MQTTTWAEVSTTFTGIHRWPDAPNDVEFLSNPHRHEFHVDLMVEQNHDDRDVEYIRLKRKLNKFITNSVPDRNLGSRSCEQMASRILDWARDLYGSQRRYKARVSEDGENGALVEYDPDRVEYDLISPESSDVGSEVLTEHSDHDVVTVDLPAWVVRTAIDACEQGYDRQGNPVMEHGHWASRIIRRRLAARGEQ